MSQLDPIELQVLLNSTAVAHQSNQLRASLRGVDTSIASTEKKFGDLTRSQMQAVNANNTLSQSFGKLQGAAVAYFSMNTATGFVNSLIQVRGEYQKTEIAFETMLGSREKANSLMQETIALAAKTPFNVSELADGAKQLLAFNVPANEVIDTLRRMGDISAGLNVPLSQLQLAFGQVKAKGKLMGDDLRQFTEAGVPMVDELAKKFNTTTGEIYQMVSAGKIGFNDVKEVLFQMTNKGGDFYNLMEEQSKSLTGQLANLQDAIEQMFNKIGQNSEGVLSGGISTLTYLVEHYSELLDVLGGVITMYGSYKAAVMLVSATQEVNNAMIVREIEVLTFSEKMKIGRLLVTERQAKATLMEAQAELAGLQAKHASAMAEGTIAGKTQASIVAKQIKVATIKVETAQEALSIATKNASAAAEVKLTAVQQLRAAATRLLAQAQAMLNATMLTNPIVLMIAAVGGLTYAYFQMRDSTNAAELAEKKIQEQRDKHKKSIEDLKGKTQELMNVLQDENASRLAQMEAYAEMQKMYPKLLQNMDLETFKKMGAKNAQKELNAEMDRFSTQNLVNSLKEAERELERLQENHGKLQQTLGEGMGIDLFGLLDGSNAKIKAQRLEIEDIKNQIEERNRHEKLSNMTNEQRLEYWQEEVRKIEEAISAQKNSNREKGNANSQLKTMAGNANFVGNSFANWDISRLQNQLAMAQGQIASINQAIGNAQKAAGDKNKSDWDAQRKEAQEKIDGMSGKQRGSKEWNEQVALIQQADAELKKYDVSLKTATATQNKMAKQTAKAERAAESLAKKQKDFIKEIEEAERDLAMSRMKNNDREIANVSEKYRKLREKAKELKLSEGQISRINQLEQKEKGAVKYNQETDQLLKDLDKEKELFAAYEAFKTQVSKEEADKRFDTAKWEFQNFGERLQAELDKLNQLQELTPEQSERKEKLTQEKEDYDKDNLAKERERYAEAYNALLSFDDKRRAVEQKYQADKIQLERIADPIIREMKLQELEYQKQMALDAINAEAYERSMVYEKMSQNLLGITQRELAVRIASLEEYLAKAKDILTEEQKAFVQKELDRAKAVRATTSVGIEEKILLRQKEEILKRIVEKQQKGIANVSEELKELEAVNGELKGILSKKFAKVSEVAGQLGSSFKELGGSLKEYDEGLGDTIETMGDLLNVASDVAGAVGSFASGDIVGGITKSIKAITSIFSIGAKARESERKAREEIKKYHDEIFQSQLNYNAELRKRVAEEVKLNDLYKSRVTNIKEEMEANKKNAQNAIKDQQEVFRRLLHAQTTVGMKTEKYGGFLGIGRKTRAVEIKQSVAEILGLGQYVEQKLKFGLFKMNFKIFKPQDIELTDEIFDKLERLNGQRPLTGDAKTAYDQLKKLRDEYGSIEQAQRELQKQYKDAITGTTADSLADSIKQGIASGKKAFSDFADDIEGFLRNAVLAGLETDLFREKTQKLQDRLAEMIEDGIISSAEREEFNRLYMAIVEESRQKTEKLNQAGLNVIREQENANSLQGAIKGMSQDSADIMSGHLAGLKLYAIDIYNAIKQSGTGMMERVSQMIEIQLNIEKNTRRTAENTDKLHDINEGIGNVAKAINSGSNAVKASGLKD